MKAKGKSRKTSRDNDDLAPWGILPHERFIPPSNPPRRGGKRRPKAKGSR